MSEYTKEQEAEALAFVESRHREYSVPEERIVLAMAKRTAEAEEAFSRLVADRDYVREGLIAERDALKARVAELEAQAKDLGALRTELADRVSLLARQRNVAQERVMELEAKLSEADNDRDALRDMLVSAEARARTAERAVEKLKTRVAELNKRPWIEGAHVVWGEHEADEGVIGFTLAYVEPLRRRAAELEDRVAELARQRDAAEERVMHLEAKVAPPPVVVTREMVEALVEFAETWAHWEAHADRTRSPTNAAADTVVAWRKALEVKP